MSRDLADENYYVSHGGKIPVKWTAPEVSHRFTSCHSIRVENPGKIVSLGGS